MSLKVVVMLALVAAALARPEYHATEEPAKYAFKYEVDDPPSNNYFGHEEARNGPHTQGNYFVRLPDGRLQKVDYTVDGDSGFVADVTFEGEAQYPPPKPKGYA